MGQFGRITNLTQLPPDTTVVALVQKAAALNLAGENAARPVKRPKEPIPMPADFRAALARSGAAQATFDGFAPSRQRDYLEWITEAKAAATRAKRIAAQLEVSAQVGRRHRRATQPLRPRHRRHLQSLAATVEFTGCRRFDLAALRRRLDPAQ